MAEVDGGITHGKGMKEEKGRNNLVPVTHTNRKGHVYYLHQTQTKTGKPRYFFSRDPGGPMAEGIPEGFEIHETVNAQVYLRKAVPSLISDLELQAVKSAVAREAHLRQCIVEVIKDTIVIHEASGGLRELPREFARNLARLAFGDEDAVDQRLAELDRRVVRYEPVMRFVLLDKAKREFGVERMTYRGEGGWRSLHQYGKVADLAKKFVRHIGRESFFELL